MQGMTELIREDADKGFENLEFVDDVDGVQSLSVGER